MALPKIEFLRGEPFSFAYSDLTVALQNGTSGAATATSFAVVFAAGNKQVVFHGSFVVSVSGDIQGGTVTGFDVFHDSTRVMTASGYSLPFAAVTSAIVDMQSDDQTAFRNLFVTVVRQIGSSETDHMYGATVRGFMLGQGGDDFLYGDDGRDTIKGGTGDDWMEGRGGNDRLAGGGGDDTFGFTLVSGSVDEIRKFSHDHDQIFLDAGIFTALTTGPLDKLEFVVGHKAKTAEQHIVYNRDSGALFYDPDGAGGAGQLKFATLDPHTKLKAADFDVDFVA